VVGTGLACFLAQWASVGLWVEPARVSTVWFPGGLLLAIALRSELRRWPSLMLSGAAGSALLFMTLGLTPPAAAISLGVLTALQTAGLGFVLLTVLPHPLGLRSFHQFSRYLVVAGLGGTLVASLLFMAGSSLSDLRPASFVVWRTFTISALAGYLMVTPSVLFLTDDLSRLLPISGLIRRIAVRRWLEFAVLILLLLLSCSLVFRGSPAGRSAAWTAYAMTLPPLLLWAAMRFGGLGASAALLLVTVNSTLSTNHGRGPFTDQSPGNNTLSLQLFIMGSGVPLLSLAILLEERKRATEQLRISHLRLRQVNRKLIGAREEEAARIAAELHDDVGQRLALVSIGLSRLRQTGVPTNALAFSEIEKLQEQTSAIARLLRGISRQLHPATLDHAGLAPALQLLTDEVGQSTGLSVRMHYQGDCSGLSRDVALSLYRVAQEGLTNVIRHSGAQEVVLSLQQTHQELVLEINDNGKGFAQTSIDPRNGLGLHSATERVRLVGGRLTVDSAPGLGTLLRATVPLQVPSHG
jgi:signal transduction histidine kinase